MRHPGVMTLMLLGGSILAGCVGYVQQPEPAPCNYDPYYGYSDCGPSPSPVVVEPPAVVPEIHLFGHVGGREEHAWGARGRRSRGWRR